MLSALGDITQPSLNASGNIRQIIPFDRHQVIQQSERLISSRHELSHGRAQTREFASRQTPEIHVVDLSLNHCQPFKPLSRLFSDLKNNAPAVFGILQFAHQTFVDKFSRFNRNERMAKVKTARDRRHSNLLPGLQIEDGREDRILDPA